MDRATSVGTAFGLQIEADLPLAGLGSAVDPDLPIVELRQISSGDLDAFWPWPVAELIVDRRLPDGERVMSVQMSREAGYLVDTPDHGRFRIEMNGGTIDCVPSVQTDWQWLRPLYAQALPIASALNGREVLHASGVVVEAGAVAFVGNSGAGKTTLALRLAEQGARLLADDVVALSVAPGGVIAHPGVSFANIAPEQLGAVAPGRPDEFGRLVGSSDKLHMVIEGLATEAAPLRSVYFLDRGPASPEFEFVELNPLQPNWLLSATFLPHVAIPSRQRAQLAVCAQVAETVDGYHVKVPPSVEARALASAVGAHLARHLGADSKTAAT
jgi:hypothetical protein